MKKIENYILSNLLLPFGFCFLLITAIYIIIDLSTELDFIVRNNIGVVTVIEYYFYSLPQIVYEMIPLCLLVATIYSLTKMNRFNEIVAIRASGISLATVLKPYFSLALVLMALMFLNQEKLIPYSHRKLKDIENIMEHKSGDKVYSDVTFYARGNRLIFARNFYPAENLLDEVVILEHDHDQRVHYKIRAESAQYLQERWVLYNLIMYRLAEDGRTMKDSLVLGRKEYDLRESPQELLAYEIDLEHQPLRALRERILSFRHTSEEVTRQIAIEFYHKISFPFTNFALLFLGIYVGLKSRHLSLLKGLGVALIIGFSYYGLDAFAYTLGKGGFVPPFTGAFFANIFFLSLGVFLLTQNLRH